MKYLKFKKGDNETCLEINGLNIRYFAGIPTICYDDNTFAYHNGGKECFLGEYKGVYAHENTQEKANEMAKYWFYHKTIDKDKLAKEIKERGKITILEFKLLTNMYCEYTDKVIESATLRRIFTIDEAIELSKMSEEAHEKLKKYLI